MTEKVIGTLKHFGGGILIIGIFVGIFIGLILLVSLFLKGILWLSELLYPWLVLISGITFFIAILILLPLGIFKKTRVISGIGLMYAGFVLGITTWVWSFLLAYLFWGFWGLFIGLLLGGVGVIPVAMFATLFNGEWGALVQLVLLVTFAIGFKIFGAYIATRK